LSFILEGQVAAEGQKTLAALRENRREAGKKWDWVLVNYKLRSSYGADESYIPEGLRLYGVVTRAT